MRRFFRPVGDFSEVATRVALRRRRPKQPDEIATKSTKRHKNLFAPFCVFCG